MAGDSRVFFQKYLESSLQFKSDIGSITSRFEEEFKNGEDLDSVLNMKTLSVVKDETGKLENFHQVLKFGKSRKKNATSPTNVELKLDSNQNVTSSFHTESEFETLKDISYCVASCIKDGESEPSDADTLSSYSTCSEETDTSNSEYKESPPLSRHRHGASREEHFVSEHVLSEEDTSDELNGYKKEHQTERNEDNFKFHEKPVMNETFTLDQTSRTPPRKDNQCVKENPLRRILTKFSPFDNMEIRRDESISYLSNHDASKKSCLSKSDSQLVDSGFSTMHEGHSNLENEKSENVPILSVKNLKVFNESFTEKNSPLFNITEMKSPEQLLQESAIKNVNIKNWISDVNHGKTVPCLQTNEREVEFDDFEHHLTPFSPAKSRNPLALPMQSKYLIRSPEDELNRSIERQNNRQAMKPSEIIFDRPIIKKAVRRCNRQNIADAFRQLKTCNVGDLLMTDSHTIITNKGRKEITGLESRKMFNTGKRYLDEIDVDGVELDGTVTRSDNLIDFRLPNKYRKIQKKGRCKTDRSFERKTNSTETVSAVQEDILTSPKAHFHKRIDPTEQRYSSSVAFTRKGLDDSQRRDIYEDDNRQNKDDLRYRHQYNKGYQPFSKQDEYNSDDSEVSSDEQRTDTNDYSHSREKPQHFLKAPIHEDQQRDYVYKMKPHQENSQENRNKFQVDKKLPSNLRSKSPNNRDESSVYRNKQGHHIQKQGNLSVTPKSSSKKHTNLRERDVPSDIVHPYPRKEVCYADKPQHNLDYQRVYDDEQQNFMGHPEHHIDNYEHKYDRKIHDEHQNGKHRQSYDKHGHRYIEHQTDKHVHRYDEHQNNKHKHGYNKHQHDKQGHRYDEQQNEKQGLSCDKPGNNNKNQGYPFDKPVCNKDKHGDQDVKLRQTVGKSRKNHQHEEYKDKHGHQKCNQQLHNVGDADMEDEFKTSQDKYHSERRRNRQDRPEPDFQLYPHHEKDNCNKQAMSKPNTEHKNNYFVSPNTLDKTTGRQDHPRSHNTKVQQMTSQNLRYHTSGRHHLQTKSRVIQDTDREGVYSTHHGRNYSESQKSYQNSSEQSDEDAIGTGLRAYYKDAKDYDDNRSESEDSSYSDEQLVIANNININASMTSRQIQEKHAYDEQQHYWRSLLQSDKKAENCLQEAKVNRMYTPKSVTPKLKNDKQYFETDGKRTQDQDSGSVRKENNITVSRRSCTAEFVSPESHRHMTKQVNNHYSSPSVSNTMRSELFSPSGSMARLKLSTPTSSRKKQTQEAKNVETPASYKKELSNRTDSRAELTPRSNKMGTPKGQLTGNDLSPAQGRRRRPIGFSSQNMSPVCSQGNFLNDKEEVQTHNPELQSKVREHESIKQGAQRTKENWNGEFDKYMNDVIKDSVGFISLDKLSKYTKQFNIKHGQFKDSEPKERIGENYTKAIISGSGNDDLSSDSDTYDINSNVQPYKNYYQKVVEKVKESDCEKENVRKILSNSKSNRTGHGLSQTEDPKMRKSLFAFQNPNSQYDLTATKGNGLHSPVPTESRMKIPSQVSRKDSKINAVKSQGHHYENSKQRHFRQSTPVKKGVLLQMNETMSTILGSEETDRGEDDEIILL